MTFKAQLLAAFVTAISLAAPLQAAVVSTEAIDNATVRPGGPRTGASGKAFFNVEGDSFGSNSSYGVIDFDATAFQVTSATAVSALKLSLVEANATFTAPGSVQVYLASVSTANIQPGSSLAYQSSVSPMGVGAVADFGTLTALGSIPFTTTGNVGNGKIDFLELNSLAAGPSSALAALLNANGRIRFILVPETAGTAATWAGYTNNTSAGPTLQLTTDGVVVPEPASLGLLTAAGVLLFQRRRQCRLATRFN